jgi:RimJ/RimL family protein N-acetyltransferase
MGWRLTGDVEVFVAWAGALLAGDPVEHTVPLTIIDQLRTGRRSYEEPLFAWYADGGVVRGAALLTPPSPLVIAVAGCEAVPALAAALRARLGRLPGVSGPVGSVEAFLAAWGGDAPPAADMTQRLYVLDELVPPPWPPGSARAATPADAEQAVRWVYDFQRELGEGGHQSVEKGVAAQIAERRLWLWVGADGRPAAFAGRSPAVAGVARVGPVYTPPEHRRHGYGTAVSAACTADALRRGALRTVLFADLTNPTSNAIYQRIGYRPVTDRRMVRFA